MPLPPAPTRRAARLDPEAFMAPPEGATPTTKRQRSTRGEAHPVAVPAAATADAPVVAPAPAAPKAPASRSTKMPAKAALLSSAQAPEVAPSPETAPAVSAENPRRARKVRNTVPTKLFVLDTNVLLHDPSSLFRFEEHDIYLPMITLEELDGHKKGMSEVARNVPPGQPRTRCPGRQPRTTRARWTAAAASRSARTGHREAGGKPASSRPRLLDFTAARRPAAGQGGQPDPRRRPGPAQRSTHGARGGAGVQGHQHAHEGPCAGPAGGGLLQNDKALEDGDLLYTGVLPLPSRTSGSRIGKADGKLAAAPATPSTASAGRMVPLADDQPVCLLRGAGRAPTLYAKRHRDHAARPRCCKHAQGLHPRQELGLGHHRPQPGAELRA
jgi:PhoH-like ATPase